MVWVTAPIRSYVDRLPKGVMFCTRDVLNHGKRNSVDKVLSRMVIAGDIVRLAPGLFVRIGSKLPSLREIVEARASALGRKLSETGAKVAQAAGLLVKTSSPESSFDVDTWTSSFRVFRAIDSNAARIQLRTRAARKRALADDVVGRAIKALWQMEDQCDLDMLRNVYHMLNRDQGLEFRRSRRLMPGWLSNLVYKQWGQHIERVVR
jgi:hypothetical protein